MLKDFLKKKIRVNSPLSVGLLFLLSAYITCFTIYLQPGSFFVTAGAIISQPLLILLNYLPVLLLVSVLFFLFNNLFASLAIWQFIWGTLSYINRIKTGIRNDPLVPRDITLIREAVDAAGRTEIKIDILPLVLLMVSVVIFVILAIKIDTGLFKKIWKRVLFTVCAAVLTVILTFTFFVSESVYSLFHMPTIDEEYNAAAVCDRYGFPYFYIRNLTVNPVVKPEGYSDSDAVKYLEDAKKESSEETKRVSVQFVMSEAFSDIFEDSDMFEFTEENDPMKNFHRLEKNGDVISGDIVVHGFGGGTANTEFDVLTGMNTAFISENCTSAFSVIRKTFPNLADLFSEEEYNKSFLHPGDSWFYNRANVYDYFGFDELVFNDVFKDSDKKGGDKWISDEAFEKKYIELFEKSVSQGKHSFSYGVTTQNHMAYGTYKYPDLELEEIKIKKPVSEHCKDVFAAYMMGIKDSDKLLGDLVDYYDKTEEPVLLIFFGDHKPYLGWGADSYLGYDEAGYDYIHGGAPEDIIKTHTAPFIIYVNEACKKIINLKEEEKKLSLPEDNVINAQYLGALIAEILGKDGGSEYLSLVNEARGKLPVIINGACKSADGSISEAPTDIQFEIERRLRYTQYYLMMR